MSVSQTPRENSPTASSCQRGVFPIYYWSFIKTESFYSFDQDSGNNLLYSCKVVSIFPKLSGLLSPVWVFVVVLTRKLFEQVVCYYVIMGGFVPSGVDVFGLDLGWTFLFDLREFKAYNIFLDIVIFWRGW